MFGECNDGCIGQGKAVAHVDMSRCRAAFGECNDGCIGEFVVVSVVDSPSVRLHYSPPRPHFCCGDNLSDSNLPLKPAVNDQPFCRCDCLPPIFAYEGEAVDQGISTVPVPRGSASGGS